MEFPMLPNHSTAAPAQKTLPASSDLAMEPQQSQLSMGGGLQLAQTQADLPPVASAPPHTQGRNQSTSIKRTTASADSSSTQSQRLPQVMFRLPASIAKDA
jgi:hypothetical protein